MASISTTDRSYTKTMPTGNALDERNGRSIVELAGLRHSYGDVEVLHGIDLVARPGELIQLLGPSGSGKTTVLAIAGGLLKPSEGSVELLGDELYGAKGAEIDVARRGGFILQASATIPFLTVKENLFVRRVVRNESVSQDDKERAHDLLVALDLESKSERYPNELSGGERQRVCVAAALFAKTPLILADEPTASLDRARGRSVMQLLAEHASREGAAVIAATHDERSLDLADRVITIEDGKLAR